MQEITRIEWKPGEVWPVVTVGHHAACCLGFNTDHPQLLVSGGRSSQDKAVRGTWLFDFARKRWKEVYSGDVDKDYTSLVEYFVLGYHFIILLYIGQSTKSTEAKVGSHSSSHVSFLYKSGSHFLWRNTCQLRVWLDTAAHRRLSTAHRDRSHQLW